MKEKNVSVTFHFVGKYLFLIGFIGGMLLATPVTEVQAGEFLDKALGFVCEDTRCTIRRNVGGLLITFANAAKEALNEDKLLVIDGECSSACAILADKARPNVCITRRAVFRFHKASITGRVRGRIITKYSNPPQSSDIDLWVKSQGGYPDRRFLRMYATQAVKFWPMCE